MSKPRLFTIRPRFPMHFDLFLLEGDDDPVSEPMPARDIELVAASMMDALYGQFQHEQLDWSAPHHLLIPYYSASTQTGGSAELEFKVSLSRRSGAAFDQPGRLTLDAMRDILMAEAIVIEEDGVQVSMSEVQAASEEDLAAQERSLAGFNLGLLGGRARTPAKRAASAANGRKGAAAIRGTPEARERARKAALAGHAKRRDAKRQSTPPPEPQA